MDKATTTFAALREHGHPGFGRLATRASREKAELSPYQLGLQAHSATSGSAAQFARLGAVMGLPSITLDSLEGIEQRHCCDLYGQALARFYVEHWELLAHLPEETAVTQDPAGLQKMADLAQQQLDGQLGHVERGYRAALEEYPGLDTSLTPPLDCNLEWVDGYLHLKVEGECHLELPTTLSPAQLGLFEEAGEVADLISIFDCPEFGGLTGQNEIQEARLLIERMAAPVSDDEYDLMVEELWEMAPGLAQLDLDDQDWLRGCLDEASWFLARQQGKRSVKKALGELVGDWSGEKARHLAHAMKQPGFYKRFGELGLEIEECSYAAANFWYTKNTAEIGQGLFELAMQSGEAIGWHLKTHREMVDDPEAVAMILERIGVALGHMEAARALLLELVDWWAGADAAASTEIAA